MIDLRQISFTDLQLIAIIAETGNLTRASEVLHLTQPAVSHRLKNLNQIIGDKVVDRVGKTFVVTESGAVLLELFHKIQPLYMTAEERLGGLDRDPSGPLTIGTTDTLGIYFLPQYVRLFNQKHPNLRITLTTKPSRIVAKESLRGEVDVGIALVRSLDDRFVTYPLIVRRDCIIVSANSRFRNVNRIGLAEIADEPFVTLDRMSQSRYFLVEWFRKAGVSIHVRLELGSIEMVKKYVALDFGFSIVPELSIESEVASGVLHRIEIMDDVPYEKICAFVPKNQYTTLAARRFIEFLEARVDKE